MPWRGKMLKGTSGNCIIPLVGVIGLGCAVLIILPIIAISMLGYNFGGGKSGGGGASGGISVDDKRKDITPEEWEQIFKTAEEKTGTPWEVSAAIVYNESGGGRNFGGCSYNAAAPSGGHVLTSGNGLRSTGDKTAFERIVTDINYPKNEPVSCNPSGSNGGAMGYMQIMPKEWEANSKAIVRAKIASGTLNPWNAQDAAYAAARIIRCKAWEKRAGDQAYCDFKTTFPETELGIKRAAGGYHGSGPSGTYAAKVYAKYLKFKQAGHITK